MWLQSHRRQVGQILHDCFKLELNSTWVSETSEDHSMRRCIDMNSGNPKDALYRCAQGQAERGGNLHSKSGSNTPDTALTAWPKVSTSPPPALVPTRVHAWLYLTAGTGCCLEKQMAVEGPEADAFCFARGCTAS